MIEAKFFTVGTYLYKYNLTVLFVSPSKIAHDKFYIYCPPLLLNEIYAHGQALPNWILGPSFHWRCSRQKLKTSQLFKCQRRYQPDQIRSPYANTLTQTLANHIRVTPEKYVIGCCHYDDRVSTKLQTHPHALTPTPRGNGEKLKKKPACINMVILSALIIILNVYTIKWLI